MKEFIEKLIGRLEKNALKYKKDDMAIGINVAIEIVNELAEEYKGGWIPCSEPPKNFMLSDGQYIPFLVCDDLIWHPYIAFYDGKEWSKGLTKIEPIAWMPLPETYKGE